MNATLEVPPWFDADLMPLLERKLDRSTVRKRDRTLDWFARQHLKMVPRVLTGIDTNKLTWLDIAVLIEAACNHVRADAFIPDVVVGVKSGGAFVAPYVARCLGVTAVEYVAIGHYSDVSRSVVRSAIQCHDQPAVVKQGLSADVAGKRVLLVDDQAATGATLVAGIDYLHRRGAGEVRTLCLYARRGGVDYVARAGLMLYPPWGKDA